VISLLCFVVSDAFLLKLCSFGSPKSRLIKIVSHVMQNKHTSNAHLCPFHAYECKDDSNLYLLTDIVVLIVLELRIMEAIRNCDKIWAYL
jgi:hypothetical protein